MTHPSDHSWERDRLLHHLSEIPPTSPSDKKHFWSPSSVLKVTAAIVFQGMGGESAAQSRQVVIWGKFILSLYHFLLQFLVGRQVCGPLTSPEVLCAHLFAWLSETKGIPLTKRFLVLFFGLSFIFNNIAKFLLPHEVIWCLRFALKYSTTDESLGEWNVAANRPSWWLLQVIREPSLISKRQQLTHPLSS